MENNLDSFVAHDFHIIYLFHLYAIFFTIRTTLVSTTFKRVETQSQKTSGYRYVTLIVRIADDMYMSQILSENLMCTQIVRIFYDNDMSRTLFFLCHWGSIEGPYSNYSPDLFFYTTPVARQKILIFCFTIGVV